MYGSYGQTQNISRQSLSHALVAIDQWEKDNLARAEQLIIPGIASTRQAYELEVSRIKDDAKRKRVEARAKYSADASGLTATESIATTPTPGKMLFGDLFKKAGSVAEAQSDPAVQTSVIDKRILIGGAVVLAALLLLR